MRVRALITLVCALTVCAGAYSQDIHFSQFWASPLSLNPLNSGNYIGNWRVMNNFRTQWGAIQVPYRTISVGFDMPFQIQAAKFGWGLYLVNDKSGVGSLLVNKIYASGAWHPEFGNHIIHVGIQIGYVIKNFNATQATFSNQFNMGTGLFDSNLPNNENNLVAGLSYPDVNAGVGWNVRAGKFKPEVYLSFFHLNNPQESFLPDNNKLPIRSVAYGGARIRIGEKFFLYPRILYMGHVRSSDFNAGLSAGFTFKQGVLGIKCIHFGPYFRNIVSNNFDAVIPALGLTIKNFDLGVSYDINYSRLAVATSHRGALELSLIYTVPTTTPTTITIPCDRY